MPTPNTEPLRCVKPCRGGWGNPSVPPCWPTYQGVPRPGFLLTVGAAKGHCVSQAPLQGELFGDCFLFHFLAFLPSALPPPGQPGRFS